MNEKRQTLIAAALELFYHRGINSTGINEILSTSGVAKKTLYKHFESKEELVLATLSARHAIFLSWLDHNISGCLTNEQLVLVLFTALERWFYGAEAELGDFRGCFFINTSAEFCDPNGKISVFCKVHKERIRALIQQHMPEENALLLDLICLLKEGAIVAAYVSHDLASAKRCITIIEKVIPTIRKC